MIAGEIDQGIRGRSDVYLEEMIKEPLKVPAETAPRADYATFYRTTELEPQSIEAWIGRAGTAPSGDEAIRSLAKAIKLDPSKTEIRPDLEKKLEGHLLKSTSSGLSELLGLGHYLSEEGFPLYAENVYRRVTELDPNNEEAWLGRARSTDNPAERTAFIQRCLEINPNNAAALEAAAPAKRGMKENAVHLVERGNILIQSGNMAEAHLLFTRAIQLDPQNDSAWLGCARSTESLPAKLSFVKQALEINPRNNDARALNHSIARFMGSTEGDRWSPVRSALRAVSLGVVGMGILVSVLLLSAFKLR